MRIIRYLRLVKAFFLYNLKGALEYRGEVFFWTVNSFLWLGMAVVALELIFGQVDTIAGWDKNRSFLVLFIASLFSDICWTAMFLNLSNFSKYIRRGTLDAVLLKPINDRFMISFQSWDFDHWARIILEIYLIGYYAGLVTPLSILNIFAGILVFLSGVIIFYSLFFGLTVTNIWFVNLDNLLDLFDSVKELGTRPVYIFKNYFLYFFSFLLPVGFIATFPAEALIGELSLGMILAAPALAILFYWLSDRFFKYALKYYSSASS